MYRFVFFIWIVFVFVAMYGQSEEDDIKVGVVEKLDEYIPGDIWLTGKEGDSVNLKTIINKPTVISLVYYRCPGICSPLMEGMADMMDIVKMKMGEDYDVVTVSFDPTETQELAQQKKENYVSLMSNKSDEAREHWQFFTSDSSSIRKLTEAVGFRYKRQGNDFVHAGTLIMVSPSGKITRYLYGTYFLPFDLKMATIEASKEQSGPTINRLLQYCYSYDPVGKTYVLNITKMVGGVIAVAGLIVFLILILKPRKKYLAQQKAN